MAKLLIGNACVADGTGGELYRADILIEDGRIAAVSEEPLKRGDCEVIDAGGLIVSPGFIDIHTHSDWAPFSDTFGCSKLMQGVTTEITGNCGGSPFPTADEENGWPSLKAYRDDVRQCDIPLNLGQLVGHGSIRSAVLDHSARQPDGQELERECVLLERELSSGAFGMSLGLFYPPSAFAGRAELEALASVVKRHDAVLTVHMRNEAEGIFEALDEVLDIVRATGVRLEISHLKLMGKKQWGKTDCLLRKIRAARAEGLPVTCDMYPYTASSTSLHGALLPKEAQEGGREKMLDRLDDPSQELISEICRKIEGRGGADKILITDIPGYPEYRGQYLFEIAEAHAVTAEEAAMMLILQGKGESSAVFFCMDENDMMTIMREECVSIGSDGNSVSFDLGYDPHPRFYGTFPHFLHLALGQGMQIGEAVRKMTGQPAQVLGIHDRGLVREGMRADITVFDPECIDGSADYVHPQRKPTGIRYVIVNGKIAVRNNEAVCENAGMLLTRGK